MDPDVTKLVLLLLVGAGAAFIQRVSGFGLGIFAMLFLPHVLPSAAAAAVSCFFSCGSSGHAIRVSRYPRILVTGVLSS